jgi:hypothetical protein
VRSCSNRARAGIDASHATHRQVNESRVRSLARCRAPRSCVGIKRAGTSQSHASHRVALVIARVAPGRTTTRCDESREIDATGGAVFFDATGEEKSASITRRKRARDARSTEGG